MLLRTVREGGSSEPFRAFRTRLGHVRLVVRDAHSLAEWQAKLDDRGVARDPRASEWAPPELRDRDNIAEELVFLKPDSGTGRHRPCADRLAATHAALPSTLIWTRPVARLWAAACFDLPCVRLFGIGTLPG